MDGDRRAADGTPAVMRPLRHAQASASDKNAISILCAELGDTDYALIAVFASPGADLAALGAELAERCHAAAIMGCSTAGELGAGGYEEGEIVAVGFPAEHFDVRCLLLPNLSNLTQSDVARETLNLRSAMERNPKRGEMPSTFALLLTDGLSLREDTLAAAISPALGGVPLFGGSAGDGTRFAQTKVMLNGTVCEDAAVLALVRTSHSVQVFSLDHFHPTDTRMVVTEADPATRRVMQINAAPAARELARVLGKDPDQLSPMTFAAHPLVVRLGGQHHVRAIREVDADGALVFFSAIDAGLVLSLAESEDMATHLETQLERLAAPRGPDASPGQILACDCILRRLEAAERQQTRAVSAVLRQHGVIGFSTYGEQIGARHVNQTMTGVVLHPPAPNASGQDPD